MASSNGVNAGATRSALETEAVEEDAASGRGELGAGVVFALAFTLLPRNARPPSLANPST